MNVLHRITVTHRSFLPCVVMLLWMWLVVGAGNFAAAQTPATQRRLPATTVTRTQQTRTQTTQTRRPVANDPPRGGTTQRQPAIGTVRPRTTPGARPGTTNRAGPVRGVQPRPAATGTLAQPLQPVATLPRTPIDYCTLCVSTLASIDHPLVIGSLARHVALGGGGYGFSGDIRTYGGNPFVIDSYNITVNPAFGDRFRNVVFVNAGAITGLSSQPLSSFGGPFVGAIFEISPRVTFGGTISFESFPGVTGVNTDIANSIALSSTLGLAQQYNGGLAPSPGFTQLRARNAAQLQLTYNTGDGKGGVVLAGAASFTTTSLGPLANEPRPQPAANITQLGFTLGLLITTATTSMFDLSGTVLLPRVSLPIPNSTNGSLAFASTIIAVNARYIARVSQAFTLIPIVNLYTVSSGSPYYSNITSIDAGLGFNYLVGPLLFVGGVSLSSNSGGNSASLVSAGANPALSQELILPRFNLGVEYAVINWLRIRAGYAGYSSSSRSNDVVVPTYFNYALSQGVSLGLGFVFGNFNLDVTTDTETLRRGLGNIGSGQPTFGFISANFRF
jgi:hypothetical protein